MAPQHGSPAAACSDGIKSCGRRLLLGKNGSEWSMSIALPFPKGIAVEQVAEEAATNGTIHCGYDGCIITYPVEHDWLNKHGH